VKIRVLYFEGCPNHRPVVEMVRRLVAEHDLDASIEEHDVEPGDEAGLRFLGSPTVQVDGVDIEPAARQRTDYAMSCRVYHSPGGLPSEEMLLAALGVKADAGQAPSRERPGLLASGGSVLAAALSSACCWLPLLLLAFGASAAGVSAFFERWRPVLSTVAFVMLGIGFYLAYFRRTAACAPRTGGRRVFTQVMLWFAAVLVIGFVLFPRYAGVVARAVYGDGQAAAAALSGASLTVQRYTVEGMTCEACAVTLQADLSKIDGVAAATVDYATKSARIETADPGIVQEVQAAARRHGYKATPAPDEP
jgi:copper chaperone CopZ